MLETIAKVLMLVLLTGFVCCGVIACIGLSIIMLKEIRDRYNETK